MDELEELEERVDKFNNLSLPGQPGAVHLGTVYLVNDLWREVKQLRGAIDEIRNIIATRGDAVG